MNFNIAKTLTSKNILALFLAISFLSTPSQAEIAVVVSSKSSVDSISKKEIKSIFLGRSRKLPNGQFAIPINQPENTKLYSDFSMKAMDKRTEELKEFWSKRIFSGKAIPPRVVDGDKSIKHLLNNIPGTISYIDSSNIDSSVKVIFTLP